MVYMPRKAALILMLVLSTICLIDGSSKKDLKEILVGVAVFSYGIYGLVSDNRKKKKAEQPVK